MRFYGADRFLAASVTDFVICGLRAGERCIVLAASGHIAAIESGMEAAGLNLSNEQHNGLYFPLEAAHALSLVLEDSLPDRNHLTALLGCAVEQQPLANRVRVYEELVAELATNGNEDASRRLEQIWFEIGRELDLTLYSYYTPVAWPAGPGSAPVPYKSEIRHETDGSARGFHPDLADDRLHDPAYLRLRAKQLEAELEELDRKISEKKKDHI